MFAMLVAACDALPAPFRPMVTRDEVIAIARRAIDEQGLLGADEEVLEVRQVTYAEVANDVAAPIEGERPADDACVWLVDIGSNPGPLMGQGVQVVIGCETGNVVHVTSWIS